MTIAALDRLLHRGSIMLCEAERYYQKR